MGMNIVHRGVEVVMVEVVMPVSVKRNTPPEDSTHWNIGFQITHRGLESCVPRACRSPSPPEGDRIREGRVWRKACFLRDLEVTLRRLFWVESTLGCL